MGLVGRAVVAACSRCLCVLKSGLVNSECRLRASDAFRTHFAQAQGYCPIAFSCRVSYGRCWSASSFEP